MRGGVDGVCFCFILFILHGCFIVLRWEIFFFLLLLRAGYIFVGCSRTKGGSLLVEKPSPSYLNFSFFSFSFSFL